MKKRGYFLISALIAVALVAAVTITFMRTAELQARVQRASDAAGVQAREMAQIAEAARTYVAENQANWRPGERVEVQLQTLIDGRFLVEGFADRLNNGIGTTPLGQQYYVVSILSTEADAPLAVGTARTVVFQRAEPRDGASTLVGVAPGDSALANFQRQSAQIAGSLKTLSTGFVDRSQSVAVGVSTSFSKDLAAWIGNANPPLFVALVGFPDLDGNNTNPNGGGPKYTNCAVISGTGGCAGSAFPFQCQSGQNSEYRQPQCPAGKVEVKRFPLCSIEYTIVDTPVGALTTGIETIETPNPQTQDYYCNGENLKGRLPADVLTRQVTSLNNVVVLRDQCSQTSLIDPTSFSNCPNQSYAGWGGSPQNLVCCELVR